MATCPTCRTRHPDGVALCTLDGVPLVPDAALENTEPELAPGTMVGEYCIEAKLGEGGFGTVYRAVHPLIGKAAAIKVLSRQYSSNPSFVSRFISEARAVNQIRHRNIIDIFSFGALEDGRQYYVMELLEGIPLDVYLKKRGRLSPSQALPLLVKIARALDAAHAAGIAHRDLKPENVYLVFDEDNVIFPKLLDFGIAKLLGDSSSSLHKTRTGHAMGTPLYMSPEQCRGKNVDHRTDIYSFGIMVHELLTGQLPFDAEDPLDILFKQTSTPAPSLSSVNPDLSPAFDAPLLRMLEKDPANRPSSLTEAMAALIEAARSAGHDVPAVAQRTSEGGSGGGVHIVMSKGPGSARPDELAVTQEAAIAKAAVTQEAVIAPGPALTPARTGSNQTQIAMQTSLEGTPAHARRRTALLAGIALVGAAVVAMITLRPSEGGGSRLQASATPALPATSAAPPQVQAAAVIPAPTIAPAASTAAPPDEVELTIKATPRDAEIWRDGKLVGNASEPLRLPRGQTVKLTFKAPSYQEQTQEVPVETSGAITVSMKKTAVTRAGVRKKGDLENPFQ